MSTEVIYTLLYLLFCFFIVYPSDELISAGLTMPDLLHNFLGSESEQFVQYHIKRSSLTIFIYSLLPSGYFLGSLLLNENELFILNLNSSLLWKIFITSTIILPVTASIVLYSWSKENWSQHPIAKNIEKFSNNNTNWRSVAACINDEYRRIDKICIQVNPICKVIATENWLIKVTATFLHVVHQSDASFVVSHSDVYAISPDDSREVQFINIDVNSNRRGIKPFTLRINSMHFKTLQDRVARKITVLPEVKFHKTTTDRFIDVFRAAAEENTRYSTSQELENCMACMQQPANVKLQKMCSDNSDCQTCYCKPMWCIECMARWFVAKLQEESQNTWLSSKCTCPMCRAKFCILDVCLISTIDIVAD